MPWFEPNVSQENLDFWAVRTDLIAHKVAYWPRPNTIRIDPRFRIFGSIPVMVPLASRYCVWYRPEDEDYDEEDAARSAAGWFDFETRADNHIGVSIEENAAGYSVEIDIVGKLGVGPFGLDEVKCTIEMSHATFGTQTQTGKWTHHVNSVKWRHNHNTDNRSGSFIWVLDELPELWDEWLKVDIFAVSECFRFTPLPIGQASFNGIDAYIALDHDITIFNQDFIIDVDVRLTDNSDWWPVFGRGGADGFIGMQGADFIFGSLRDEDVWTPIIDDWFNWRVEFEQPDQLKIKLFINDDLVSTNIINRFNTPINRVGVYKQGVSGTLWAEADYKNLKVLAGDSPSTDVELDMPLFDNALDVGPELNHGTTFNMELPSV